jgi:hypothetical protein
MIYEKMRPRAGCNLKDFAEGETSFADLGLLQHGVPAASAPSP